MSIPSQEVLGNRLLDALPPEVYARLWRELEPVSFSLGQVIYEAGVQMDYAYFPVTAQVSIIYTTTSGTTAEMGLVGNEGIVGIVLFTGGDTRPIRAIVHGAGSAYRLKAEALLTEFRRGGEFQRLLLRYTQALITQISQTAICNRLHSNAQRLCRWLLMTRDRAERDELQMTQEFISSMLGMRREGVTRAATSLQAKGLISYARGRIRIVDRVGLEKAVCECYAVVKQEQDRLLP